MIKKQKAQKTVIKRKIKSENHRNCLKVTWLESEKNIWNKIKLTYMVWKEIKKIIRNNKSILKNTTAERYNTFTEEIKMIGFHLNYD